MNIRTKFLAVMLSLVLITGMATILISRTVSTNIIEEQVGNHLETTAQSRAHHIETVLWGYRKTVDMMAAGNPFRDAVDESMNHTERLDSVNRRIDSVLQSNKDISRIRVLDKNGIVIASSHADVGFNKSANEIFFKGREEVYIRDVHTSELTGNYIMSVAAPILVNGKFSGVLIVNFYVDEIFGITTDRTGLGEAGEIFIINRDGYMITPSRFTNDTLPKQDVEPGYFNGTENTKPEAALYNNYRGVDVLGAHAPIPAMNWCLWAEIDETEAFASVTRLTIIMFSTLLGLLFLGTLFCIRVSGTITNPIVRLHHGTEEIMKGNLDYKVSTRTRDEIGQLSRTFDKMTANLKESGRKLGEHSRDLEKKVEERTVRLDNLLKKSERQKVVMVNIAHDLKDTNIELSTEINERKQAEDALRESEHRLIRAQEIGHVGDWEYDIEADSIVCSDELYRIYGIDPSIKLKLETIIEGIHPDDRDYVNRILASCIENGQSETFEYRIVRPDGSIRHVYSPAEVIRDGNGKVVKIFGITHDITEHKESEEKLKDYAKDLERSNELKVLFVDIMRHDLLNPAGIVQGYTEILFDMEYDEKKIDFLQKIEKHNKKLIDLIETTARFAKLESVEELEFGAMDIAAMFKIVVDNLRPQIEDKHITLEFKAEGTYSANVNPMFEEVFVNLLSNAIKYSPEKSKVIIDIIDADENWKVTVTDFGEGVLDEHKTMLFDRFQRVNKVAVKGSGLGLAIVKRIVELHGGDVGVEDNPEGVGSVFWVTVGKA